MSLHFTTPARENHNHGVVFDKPPAFETAISILLLKSKQKHGGYLAFTLDLPYQPRTTGPRSENNCWHSWLKVGCAETGNDYDDLERYILRRAFRRDYPVWKDEKGNIKYSLNDHQPLPLPFKLSNVAQAAAALSELEQWAAEENITLPRYEEEKART